MKFIWTRGNILISRYEPLSLYYDTMKKKVRFKITAVRRRDGATVLLLDDTRFPHVDREGEGEILWNWGPYPPFNPSPIDPSSVWDIWDVVIEIYDVNNNKIDEAKTYLLATTQDVVFVQFFDENNKRLEGEAVFYVETAVDGTVYRFFRREVLGSVVVDKPYYVYSLKFPHPKYSVVKSYIEFFAEKEGKKYYMLDKTLNIIPHPTSEVVTLKLKPVKEVIVGIDVEVTRDLIKAISKPCREVKHIGVIMTVCLDEIVAEPKPEQIEKIAGVIAQEMLNLLNVRWTYIGYRKISDKPLVYRLYFVADIKPLIILVAILALTASVVAYFWHQVEIAKHIRDVQVAMITYEIVKIYQRIYEEYLNAKQMIIDTCKKLYTSPEDIERCIQGSLPHIQPPQVNIEEVQEVIRELNQAQSKISELEQVKNILLLAIIGAVAIVLLQYGRR